MEKRKSGEKIIGSLSRAHHFLTPQQSPVMVSDHPVSKMKWCRYSIGTSLKFLKLTVYESVWSWMNNSLHLRMAVKSRWVLFVLAQTTEALWLRLGKYSMVSVRSKLTCCVCSPWELIFHIDHHVTVTLYTAVLPLKFASHSVFSPGAHV